MGAPAADSRGDRDLVTRFKTGDQEAFSILLARYTPAVRRILWGLLHGNREDVLDLEQEVCLALYQALGSFRGEASLRTFVFRLCRNKAVDFIRREKRKRRMRLLLHGELARHQEGGADARLLTAAGIRPAAGDPAASLVAEEASALMKAAFFRLSPMERSLLLFKDVEGLSLAELAEVLGLPLGTVKSRLHRARGRLLAFMEKEHG